MKIPAYHTKAERSGRNVYHDHPDCTEGNNIELRNRALGQDGRPRCGTCTTLHKRDQKAGIAETIRKHSRIR